MRDKHVTFFTVFLTINALCWTIVPALTRKILPLDTIEAIVWGSGWDLGNGKHPPLSGWIAEVFYTVSGYADVSQYFLSQLLIITGLVSVYFLGRLFLSRMEAVVGSMVLLSIFFYTFTSPEYNVNVLEIAFWPLTAFIFYCAIRDNRIYQWLLVGCCAALVMWTKYFGGLLLFSLFVYMLIDKKARSRFRSPRPYLALKVFLILFLPHACFLHLHDYAPILYAAGRAGAGDDFHLIDYLVNVLRLIPMVIGIPLPAFFIVWFSYGLPGVKGMLSRFRNAWNEDENGCKFFLTLLLVPILTLQLLAICGVSILAMWYQPVFFAAGPLMVIFFRPWLEKFNWKRFTLCITAFVSISLFVYATANLTHTSKRVHFPVDEFCSLMTEKCGDAGGKELIFLGDYWSVGMLHCYLPEHPHVVNALDVCRKDDVDAALDKARSGKAVIAFSFSRASHLEEFEEKNELKVCPEKISFTCKAPLGKEKETDMLYCVMTAETLVKK